MKQELPELYGKCPYTTVQRIFSGKWAIIIIFQLSGGTLRFGELQRRIPEVTQAALTKQLRTLEEFGMVNRYVYPEVPPKVEYSLTSIGKDFLPVLEQFEYFGDKYIEYLNNNK
jgi:DNA-binding HxlR family transcriptional regulator